MGIIANLKEGSTCIQLSFYIQSKKKKLKKKTHKMNKIGEKNNINTYKQLSFGILLIKKGLFLVGKSMGILYM